MPGTLLAVGVVACAATLAVGLVAAGGAAAYSQQLAGVADAAALAAADAASGALPGVPCERAGEIAAVSGITVARCDVDGPIVTIEVAGAFARLPAAASARAGPPPTASPASDR